MIIVFFFWVDYYFLFQGDYGNSIIDAYGSSEEFLEQCSWDYWCKAMEETVNPKGVKILIRGGVDDLQYYSEWIFPWEFIYIGDFTFELCKLI